MTFHGKKRFAFIRIKGGFDIANSEWYIIFTIIFESGDWWFCSCAPQSQGPCATKYNIKSEFLQMVNWF